MRGGSWDSEASSEEVAYRDPYFPNKQNIIIGFRVVRP
jgi:formylglycine-generating enzyme required for sulfatase activity